VLASCGFGSRRAMEEMILAGRITVNRMPADVGQKVSPGDEVRINGELVKVRFAEPRARVLMYHKPTGELVTRDDPEGRPTVFEKLPSIGNGKWINIGRLDYNTEGLLLFTNSGELANRMMHPRFEVEREYAVRVMGRLDDEQVERLTRGIELDDGLAKCDRVEDAGGDDDGANHWYKVVLREGRNREVRRLFEALGLMVSRLIRTRYGAVGMPTVLKRGDLLELEPGDVASVLKAAGLPNGAPGQPSPRNDGRDARQPPRKGGRPHGARGQGGPGAGAQGGARRAPGGPGGGQGPGGPAAGGHAANGQAAPFARGQGPRGAQGRPPPHGAGPRRPGGGQGRPGGRPGGKPGFGKGPRPPRTGDDGAREPREFNQADPRDAQLGDAHEPRNDYDERQPLSNANASPFGRTPGFGGGAAQGRPFGQGGRPPRPGARPQDAGGRPQGTGRPKGAGRPHGKGPRPAGQGAQGQGPRGKGPGGRGAGPRGQGQGRPQGKGPRPQGPGYPRGPGAGRGHEPMERLREPRSIDEHRVMRPPNPTPSITKRARSRLAVKPVEGGATDAPPRDKAGGDEG
jgi:23S rRNA pseudouridine2605 synthase